LDALVTLTLTGGGFERRGGGATGYVKEAYLSHLVPHPETAWTVSPPLSLDLLTNQDFLNLVEGLEEEFRRDYTARQVDRDHDQVLLVGLITDNRATQRFKDGLTELERLVQTAGGTVLQTLKQKRSHPHHQTVVGEGKVQEIALAAQSLGRIWLCSIAIFPPLKCGTWKARSAFG
jgi:GTP-binding protein HflX